IHRIGVLDEQRLDRRAIIERLTVTGQNSANLRLVEIANSILLESAAFDLALVHAENAGIGMKRTAALILEGTGHTGYGSRGVHLDRTIALAGKAIAKAEEGALRLADKMGESLGFRNRQPGNCRSPL